MKKLLSIFMAVITVFSLVSFTVFASEDDISIKIDGNLVSFDQMPVMVNNRTMVPLRGIFENLGAEVQWIEDTRIVKGTKDDTVIELTVGSTEAFVNGKSVTLDSPATIISSRTMVPVRFIAEALGATVTWRDRPVKRVYIDSPVEEVTANSLEKYKEGKKSILSFDEWVANSTFEQTEKIYGSAKVVDVTDTEGITKALRVEVTDVPQVDSGWKYIYNKELDTGGSFLTGMMTFKARIITDEPTTTGLMKIQLEDPATYKKVIWEEFVPTNEWRVFYVPFVTKKEAVNFAMRFGYAKQILEIADFEIMTYNNVKMRYLPQAKGANGVYLVPKEMPIGEDVINTDEKLKGLGGEYILKYDDFKYNFTVNNSKNRTAIYSESGDVMKINVYEALESPGQWLISQYVPVAQAGDVCLITYKAKCTQTSSGDKGKIQMQVQQAETYKKASFEEVMIDTEWKTYYIPYTALEDCSSFAIRSAFFPQEILIKDINIINYGKNVDIVTLPKGSY